MPTCSCAWKRAGSSPKSARANACRRFAPRFRTRTALSVSKPAKRSRRSKEDRPRSPSPATGDEQGGLAMLGRVLTLLSCVVAVDATAAQGTRPVVIEGKLSKDDPRDTGRKDSGH